MTEAQFGEYSSRYDRLPQGIWDEAALMNQAFDIHAEANKLENVSGEIHERLSQESNAQIEALVGNNTLSHDDFLRTYENALLGYSRNSHPVHEFHKMMNLREQLEPGAHMLTSQGVLLTIAQPEDSEDSINDIKPLLAKQDKLNGWGETINFYWVVPTEETDTPVFVDKDSVTVGRDDIIRMLDRKYHRDADEFGSTSYPIKMRQAALQFKKLGDSERAAHYEQVSRTRIRALFNEDLYRASSSDQSQILSPTVMEFFSEVDNEGYADFIKEIKLYAADDRYQELVLKAIKGHADVVARYSARVEGKSTYTPATQLEVVELYAAFITEGQSLLEQDDEDEQGQDESGQ